MSKINPFPLSSLSGIGIEVVEPGTKVWAKPDLPPREVTDEQVVNVRGKIWMTQAVYDLVEEEGLNGAQH